MLIVLYPFMVTHTLSGAKIQSETKEGTMDAAVEKIQRESVPGMRSVRDHVLVVDQIRNMSTSRITYTA